MLSAGVPATGSWRLVAGGWRLLVVAGYWRLVAGSWRLLATDCRWLAVGGVVSGAGGHTEVCI